MMLYRVLGCLSMRLVGAFSRLTVLAYLRAGRLNRAAGPYAVVTVIDSSGREVPETGWAVNITVDAPDPHCRIGRWYRKDADGEYVGLTREEA